MFHQLSQRKCCVASNMMILEYYEKYGNFRDKIEIFILLFSCFETRSRLHIVILMFRDENEKHRLNVSRSSDKNVSQFSRDLARTRLLADLCFKWLPIAQLIADAVYKRSQRWYLSSAPENVRQLWSDLFIFSEGLNGWAMIRICKTVHSSHQLSQIVPLVNKVCLHGVNNFINQALETMLKTKVTKAG